ncbi:MAG: hypothetical protein IKS00_05530 [Bacteroidales bacterium]|nr:hypothetical protein [Bacteroidales bacterium]
MKKPTRDGYTFAGWTGTGLDVATKDVTITTGSHDNRTYTATWTKNILTLNGNQDNSEAIEAADDGKQYEVVLNNYNLYRNGEWNTICLPFGIDDFSGTVFENATIKKLSSLSLSNGKLTMKFEAVTRIEAGTPYIVKWDSAVDIVIKNQEEWNTFVSNVNRNDDYKGKTLKLATNIIANNKVGKFCGTFDGCGCTITVNIEDNTAGTALFSSINGATIKNLNVTGTIKSNNNHAAGLVGLSEGSGNKIQNCHVSVTVEGGSYVGGILGHGRSSDITIENCLFDGLLKGGDNAKGVIFGWGDLGGTKAITNCLYLLQDGQNTSNLDLVKMYSGNVTDNNCFKNVNVGERGHYTTSTGTTLASLLGSNWTEVNDKVLPKMSQLKLSVDNIVFEYVTMSKKVNPQINGNVRFEGSYAPLANTDGILFDARNTGEEAFHAALNTGMVWYKDEDGKQPASSIPFQNDGSVTLYTGKKLTITAKDNAITYGDQPTGNGVTYSGFVDGEDESVLKGTLDYDYSYTQYGNVGNTYTITPKGLMSDKYNIEYVIGKLTVEPKTIGIEWSENTEFAYDGKEHTITATAIGLVNNDRCDLTIEDNTGIAVGSYKAAVTGLENSNYRLPQNGLEQAFVIVSKVTEIAVDEESIVCDNAPEYLCNNKVRLGFKMAAGIPEKYILTFNNQQIPSQSGNIQTDGGILLDIPLGLAAGTYSGTVVFVDGNGVNSSPSQFEFSVADVHNVVRQLYDNTLCIDNHEHLFASYQWKYNGVDIQGETNQYLHIEEGLTGVYTVSLTLSESGKTVETCPFEQKVLTSKSMPTVKIYPNPVSANIEFAVEILNFDPDADYQIFINDYSGKIVRKLSDILEINYIILPEGNYTGVLLSKGVKSGFKIIVK